MDEGARRLDPPAGVNPECAEPAPVFTRVYEDFTCLNCSHKVRGNGYTNHCPRCLWSQHVDLNPGDRLAGCGGAMQPLAASQESDRTVLVHRCELCGFMRRNKASDSDDRAAVLALFGRPVPDVHRKRPSPRDTKRSARS